jgi:hypothetical protein
MHLIGWTVRRRRNATRYDHTQPAWKVSETVEFATRTWLSESHTQQLICIQDSNVGKSLLQEARTIVMSHKWAQRLRRTNRQWTDWHINVRIIHFKWRVHLKHSTRQLTQTCEQIHRMISMPYRNTNSNQKSSSQFPPPLNPRT